MSPTLFLPLVRPSEQNAPAPAAAIPRMFIEAELKSGSFGANTILFAPETVKAVAVWTPEGGRWRRKSHKPYDFAFNYFTAGQRAAADASLQQLAEVSGRPVAGDLEHLFPLCAVLSDWARTRLYHFADLGPGGSTYVSYHGIEQPLVDGDGIVAALQAGHVPLQTARRSANDACNHGRWRQDLEFERKFTFKGVPDTWRMINDLYDRLRRGDLPGFVPEMGLEFQAFDYEAHIFEVLEPESQVGYIAFIPQVNGLTCVKQKWFKDNAEIRKETLNFNVDVAPQDAEAYARKLAGGKVRDLPPYRRKRFDVNFESLETGNVYGIFFDICRTVGAEPAFAFSQCEVEYCRSRTFGPLKDVFAQFEVACAYAERFLTEHGVTYAADLYSKLDFVRAAHAGAAKKELSHV